eukprot:5466915-Pleurochrysis_carterae.AAC.1
MSALVSLLRLRQPRPSTYLQSTPLVYVSEKKCSSHQAGLSFLSGDTQNVGGFSRRVSVLLMNWLHSKETGWKGRGVVNTSLGQTVVLRLFLVPSCLHLPDSCTHKAPSDLSFARGCRRSLRFQMRWYRAWLQTVCSKAQVWVEILEVAMVMRAAVVVVVGATEM